MNKLKHSQCGRSMVEMLGVLAIIGILSIGGIAGYTKAMEKIKSNGQRRMIADLLNTAVRLKANLNAQPTLDLIDLTPVLVALGEAPDGWNYKNGYLQNDDGISAQLVYGLKTWQDDDGEDRSDFVYVLRLYFNQDSDILAVSRVELCKDVINAIKPSYSEIKNVTFWQKDTKNPNLYSGESLKSTTPIEIQQKCRFTITNQGTALFAISLKPF